MSLFGSSDTKKLLFIRHGQTASNLDDTLHKRGTTEGITPMGREQIVRTVEVCRKEGVELLFCSPEVRDVESAEILSKYLGLPSPIQLPELEERNWGEWEGRPWKEVEEHLEKMSLEERYTFVPPKGESWEQMEHRLKTALSHIIHHKEKKIAIITHGGALRGFIPILKDVPKQTSLIYDFHNASVTIFDYTHGKYKEKKINDVSHLPELLRNCIFCEIVQGKAPAFTFWENKKYMAFLSIYPNTEGFSVVIPKKHHSSYIFAMEESDLNSFMQAIKSVSQVLETKLKNVGRVAVILEGFGVDHAHAKLFPMHGTIGLKSWNKPKPSIKKYFTQYEGYVSSHSSYREKDENLKKLQEKLKS